MGDGGSVDLTSVFVVALSPLVIAYVVACFRDPVRYALPPYAVLIPFGSAFRVLPGPFGGVSSLLGLLLGAALLTQLVTTRRGSVRLPLAVPVWLAFLALSGFSLFWSIAPGASFLDFRVLASQVLLLVALVLTRFDERTLRLFATSLMAGGVAVVLYGFAQITLLGGLPGKQTGPGDGPPRFGDDLLGANNEAAALLLPLAIAVTRALTESGRSRWFHGAATLLILVGILMTGSRGGLLGALVVFMVVVWLGTARRSRKIFVAAAAAVLVTVLLVLQPGGVGRRQVENSTDSSGRTDIWMVGAQSCSKYCLLGAGWGAFPTVYQQELASTPEARVQPRGATFEPHSIFLLAVIELGLPGLLLLLVGLGIALVSAWRLPAAMRAPPMAALLATMVSSFFLSNMKFKFFWAVFAYVAVCETVAAVRARQKPALPTTGRLVPVDEEVR
jgi:O-antigen ligase